MAFCPFAAFNPIRGYPGGSFERGVPYRGVLHTTEVEGLYKPRSDGSYFGGAKPPHFTVDDWTVWQHIDTFRSAYALVNLSGGVETNRLGAVQVEIMGRASANPDTLQTGPTITAHTYANLARLMRWIEVTHDIRPEPWDDFHYYKPEGGHRLGREPWRIPMALWPAVNCWVGHQHLPENSHGDPGKIDLAFLFPGQGKTEVDPMYDPPIHVVASCAGPNGAGQLLLLEDAGVYLLDTGLTAPPGWVLSPVGQPYWAPRQPARIELGPGDGQWTVTATNGDRYTYPHAPG